VSAHRPEVVELSVQHSVQRSEAESGTANMPVVVELEMEEGLQLWAVAESMADELSREHCQAVSIAVGVAAAVVTVAIAASAVFVVAVDWASYALAARSFAAAAGWSRRPA